MADTIEIDAGRWNFIQSRMLKANFCEEPYHVSSGNGMIVTDVHVFMNKQFDTILQFNGWAITLHDNGTYTWEDTTGG
jgi:hypothetical protein